MVLVGEFFSCYKYIRKTAVCEALMKNIRKHIKDIIIIALLITCIAILIRVVYDINEIYKHIDLLNLFYRSLVDVKLGLPV